MSGFVDGPVTVHQGDVRECLRELPDESVQCVVTSPPYWGLRDYGADGQLGLEATPEEYVANMVAVFREVRRVLRKDATLWLNLGDSYASGGKSGGGSFMAERKDAAWQSRSAINGWRSAPAGLKHKDLVGIPWRVAFALQQPYERHVIAAPIDRAWMAGLVDGEGCVSCVAVPPGTGLNESHSMRLQIRMADTEAVERVVAITGLSKVTYDLNTGQGARPAQQWKVSGDKAADALADLYPFLTVKRKQAIVGWNIQRLKDGVVTKRGVPIPADNMAKRRLLYDLLHDLNQRRSVDLPNWLTEPDVYREPGWYLRSDVIWAKPNPMPESVTDRPTKAHEYLFLLTKSARYYYDANAIRKPTVDLGRYTKMPDGWDTGAGSHGSFHHNGREKGERRDKQRGHSRRHEGFNDRWDSMSRDEQMAAGANARSVWTIATQPYPDAHFATYPEALVIPCIKAGSKEGDVVLDPFAGSGTTLAVARRLGRKAIGIELNPEYVELIRKRVAGSALPLLEQA